mgnify:CR=1 FL=1
MDRFAAVHARAARRIDAGSDEKIVLGDIAVEKEWTFAGDVVEGILTLVHCGAPASLAADKSKVTLTRSALALERGFETMTCRPSLDQGPVTIFRFYGRECNHLHLTTGELLDSQQSPNLEARIKVHGDRQDFLDQCFGNHYLVVAGVIRNELKLLCKWLGITIFET